VSDENKHDPDFRSHFEHPHVPTAMVELPEKTRKWLADKRESDLALLDNLIETQRTMQSLGRISKWLFLTLIALIVTLGEIGQAFSRLVSFLTGGKLGGG
jgi:hypothetical protein